MKPLAVTSHHVIRPWILLVIGASATSPVLAQEQVRKPLLSEALKEALAKDPLDEVEMHFLEALASGNPEYEIDVEAVNALGLEYMQSGQTEKGVIVVGIAARAAQIAATASFPPEILEALAAREEAERKGEEEQASKPMEEEFTQGRTTASLGPSRDDLERFHGLFANPEGGPQRALFLVRNCDGYLVTGPMWADVAPWTLRSVGDREFVYDGDSFTQPFRLDLSVGPDGKAVSIKHDLEVVASPLRRIGDLDDSFLPKCRGHL
jgi:hypothetical protein